MGLRVSKPGPRISQDGRRQENSDEDPPCRTVSDDSPSVIGNSDQALTGGSSGRAMTGDSKGRADSGNHGRAHSGQDLHNRISADRWSITKTDLHRFSREVKAAVVEGKIERTGRDLFDPADTAIGPSIYTVCDQLIKPMTQLGGPSDGASYALTHHPNGMECDVFITHAWGEGVYEFIDRVIASWPWRKRSAYACMLSNPQNLNIAGLVSDPLTSPFALALKRCTHMIAVPNQNVGIYTRLWCCYEAYLAYVWGKEIHTAWTPLGAKATLKVVAGPCLAWVLGAVFALFLLWLLCSDGSYGCDDGYVPAMTFLIGHVISTVYAAFATPSLRRTVSIYISSAFIANIALLTIEHVLYGPRCQCYLSSTKVVNILVWASLSIVPTLLAVDGARASLHKADLAQLGLGFSGSIRESSCAVARDKENILASIGDDISCVDQSIRVLLKSGMSTASMRKGASLGIAVERLSFVQWGPAWAVWSGWTLSCLGLYRPGLFQLESMADLVSWQATQSIYPVIHIFLFAVSPRDQKTFIVYVVHTLLLWLVVLDFCIQLFLKHDTAVLLYPPTAMMYNVFGLLSFTISAMGLGRLASVPLLGKHCARLIIGKAPPVEIIQRAPIAHAIAESEQRPPVRVSI